MLRLPMTGLHLQPLEQAAQRQSRAGHGSDNGFQGIHDDKRLLGMKESEYFTYRRAGSVSFEGRLERAPVGAGDQFFLLACQVLAGERIFIRDAGHDDSPLRCCAV
jgi:hypothetical protein